MRDRTTFESHADRHEDRVRGETGSDRGRDQRPGV